MSQNEICVGCFAAERRVMAHYARVLFQNSIYGNECVEPFVRVVKVARYVQCQASQIVIGGGVMLHTCGGTPERCRNCGSPLILGVCPNFFCDVPLSDDEWDRLCPRPGRPMDQVQPTDHLVRKIKVLRTHDGGESLWPLKIYVTAQGDFYYTSPMLPTALKREEILLLPSRRKEEVRPTDLMLGEVDATRSRRPGEDPLSVGVSWYLAYERPETGERFRVYGHDGP